MSPYSPPVSLDCLRKASRDYLQARERFLSFANGTEALSGNDNIMGRIGEFIAWQFLIDRHPRKPTDISNPGFDLICDDHTRISVKMITHENHTGRTSRIKEPWEELIVIELGEGAEILRLGHLTKAQFNQARRAHPSWSETPYTSRSMLGRKGLIGRYGEVYLGSYLHLRVRL